MHNDLVNRTAEGIRKAEIAEESRLNLVLIAHSACCFFKDHCRDTGLNLFAYRVQDARNNSTSLAHEAELFLIFEKDAPKLFQSLLPSLDTRLFAHKAFILPRNQVRLNLAHKVHSHTHNDQQTCAAEIEGDVELANKHHG